MRISGTEPYILLLGEEVLTIFCCIKRVRLNWNVIVHDVQSATYSCHGAPCPTRDLFPRLNTRVKVHIYLWTIREYPKRHFRYLSDSGDTFLPLHASGNETLSNLLARKMAGVPQENVFVLIWKTDTNIIILEATKLNRLKLRVRDISHVSLRTKTNTGGGMEAGCGHYRAIALPACA